MARLLSRARPAPRRTYPDAAPAGRGRQERPGRPAARGGPSSGRVSPRSADRRSTDAVAADIGPENGEDHAPEIPHSLEVHVTALSGRRSKSGAFGASPDRPERQT